MFNKVFTCSLHNYSGVNTPCPICVTTSESTAKVNVEAVVTKPTRIVEVMKAHKNTYWYAEHLRELFLVIDCKQDNEVYEVVTKTYKTNKFKKDSRVIHKIDCRIILELVDYENFHL